LHGGDFSIGERGGGLLIKKNLKGKGGAKHLAEKRRVKGKKVKLEDRGHSLLWEFTLRKL